MLQALLYRRVQLQGEWLHAHTVFLENRQMRGLPGFYALVPLQLGPPGAPVVLVQRGWIPRDFADRSRVPALPAPGGVVEIEGVLAPWPSRIYDFGDAGEGVIRQNLDLALYRQSTGLRLLPLSVQQSGPPDDGLLREWPQVATGVEKHHGYAFQWFGLAVLILFLYVWFQIVQPRRQARRA
jgi:surfeit locus 1 family protein